MNQEQVSVRTVTKRGATGQPPAQNQNFKTLKSKEENKRPHRPKQNNQRGTIHFQSESAASTRPPTIK